MDLVYKQIFTHFSSEESRVGLTNPKTIFNKEVHKAFIPCSWCLLKPIERLMKFIDMVRISFTFKAGRLIHIHLFFDWTIYEGTLDVHLIKLKTMVSWQVIYELTQALLREQKFHQNPNLRLVNNLLL
jgi:hypothetical protein